MTILYVTNMRLPTERAHGAQIMHACGALAELGHTVELVVPARHSSITEDAFTYYSISTRFPITKLPTLDLVARGRIGFILQTLTFAFAAARYVRNREGLVYGRDAFVLFIISLFTKKKIIWESHDGVWNAWAKKLVRRVVGIVVVSKGARDAYIARGVHEKSIVAVPNGVDVARYQATIGVSKEEARGKLSLPRDKRIVLYSGHLHTWKGTNTLAEAASLLPHTVVTVFMGGTDADIKAFKAAHGNEPRILVVGRRSDAERPLYLRAADVLVLPNTAKDEVSVTYTSPLKLFGYMASGTPIVASDLPSVREIVSEESVFFATPDSPQSFADTILQVLTDTEIAAQRAERAQRDVRQYDWQKRATRIVNFLQTRGVV